MTSPTLMITAEVADRLQIPARDVARLVTQGKLQPALKLPGLRGAYLFDPETVREFAATRAA